MFYREEQRRKRKRSTRKSSFQSLRNETSSSQFRARKRKLSVIKRVIISILFGLIFPISYGFIAAGLLYTFPGTFAADMQLYGEPAPGPILAPILGTFYLYSWIKFHHYFGMASILDTFWFRVFFSTVPVFAFYCLTAFGVLTVVGFPKRRQLKSVNSQLPPPPPKFEQI